MNAPAGPTRDPRSSEGLGGSDALEALRRSEPVVPARAARPWLPRVTVGVVVLGGLGAAYGLLQPLLFPPRRVRVADVRVLEGGPSRARAVAEAAGWIEADPYPVTVRPLVKGVVTQFDLVEGQAVTAGETVIAVLENPDLVNELRRAEADLDVRTADLARAEAVRAAREAVLAQRLPQRVEVARLTGEQATAAAAQEAADEAVREATAAREGARIDLEAQERLAAQGAAIPISLQTARRRLEEAEAARRARISEAVRARAEAARVAELLALAREGLDAPRDLELAVAEQEAEVVLARAELRRAEVEVEVARRNVGYLTVQAPMTGIVMRLLTAPGSVAGPMEQMRSLPSEAEGTTSSGVLDTMVGGLVTLYDPRRLQARIDVPFQDVGQLGAGTEAEVSVPAVPGRSFRAQVDRVVHEANILKATLQVKVRLLDPDPALRPEMLAKAKFVVKHAPTPDASSAGRVLVPTAAVRGEAVHVVDPRGGGRARRVPVRVVAAEGEWTEVEGELGLSHRVILDPVEDGERIEADSGGPS